MSNPAVIKLQSGKIGKSKVWLDDNFGESIHIHIDDYRVDLTVSEFKDIFGDLCLTINDLVNVNGFDVRKIDPVFLSVMLWSKLPDLTGVSYDKVSLGKMLAPVRSRIVPLPESMGVKALNGLSDENNSFSRKSHHIGQDDNERMDGILKSIKENGYPYQDNYIVMYGDDNIIRDGQHRASCLYYLYGDIEVPVMRLHFKGYKSPKIGRFYNCGISVFFRRHGIKKFKSAAKKMLKPLSKLKRKMKRLFARKKGHTSTDECLKSIYNAK